MPHSIIVNNIYFLGPEGSYTEQAKNIFMKEFFVIVEKQYSLHTIKSVLKSIDKDSNSIAVLPVENSVEGIVRETIDNLIRLKDDSIKIISECILPVNHCLLAKSRDISGIKTIISHPQAIAQCLDFINRDFPTANIIEDVSTSAAAKRVSDSDDLSIAAIASEYAASLFGLDILQKNINDENDNQTRFIMLGRDFTYSTGFDKTSIAFSTKNEAGALYKVLKVFSDFKINLLYIDSRPSRKNLGEYTFFIDFEGHVQDNNIKNALGSLSQFINFYKLNGSFKRYKK